MPPLLKVLIGLLAGGVVLLIVVAVVGVYVVRRTVLISEKPSEKTVEIESPIGSLRVNKEVPQDVLARLGVPVYPGAKPTEDAAQISFKFGEQGANLTVAKFASSDPVEKVDAFYRQALGSRFKREEGKMIGDFQTRDHYVVNAKGGILYSEETDSRKTFVALEKKGGQTEIVVAKVVGREAQ